LQGSELLPQRWIDAFEGPGPSGVVQAFSAYQDPAGGFGHNLEGDFMLPASSPVTTSVAFQILSNLGATADQPLVQRGIAYLPETYLLQRPGWLTIPPLVNEYPHASWWHFQPELGGTVIDHSWGNSTAELVGCLVCFHDLLPAEVLDSMFAPLLGHTLDYRTEALPPDGVAPVLWNLENHPLDWEVQRLEIAGREILKTLVLLKRFGNIP
jgi:hypothetical protein